MSACTVIGNVANTTGVASLVLIGAWGIIAGYQAYPSPHTILKECMERLEQIRIQVQGILPQQWRKIESAGQWTRKSLAYLERQLEECVLLNIPRQTELWERITALENGVKMLLLDIWVTVDLVPSLIPKLPILLF